MRRMIRWLKWTVLVAAIGFVVIYAGDWAVYRLRGSPTSTVTVNRMLAVPLKGNKTEYDDLGSGDEPCSVSLFPQGGDPPCWRLRRNTNQVTNL